MSGKYLFPPCIGCGWCCKKATCQLGTMLHGSRPNCPSLVFDQGRYWCGEVLKDPKWAVELDVGEGCCATLNSQRHAMLLELKKVQG